MLGSSAVELSGRVMSGAVLALVLGPASTARADIYGWVDKDGVLHFTNIDAKQQPAPARAPAKKSGDVDVESFGGEGPLVLTLPDGEERKLYPLQATRYDPLIQRAADHYRLPFAFLKAIAKVESNFNPHAVSHADAKGLMQLMDGTAASLSVENPFEPEQAIFGAARYLRMLANEFDGDLSLTAAAYNAGPERVKKARGIPAINETVRYVERVLKLYRHYQRHGSGT